MFPAGESFKIYPIIGNHQYLCADCSFNIQVSVVIVAPEQFFTGHVSDYIDFLTANNDIIGFQVS